MRLKITKNRKGQSTLETALIFIVLIAFLMGLTNIWIWSNNQIVHRQVEYNNSRVEAGTAIDNYTLKWPVYTPPDLTENEVILR
jgi:hypothetical protein